MAEQEQNPTEPATPFKLEEARKRGQVARSVDFNSFVMVWVLLLGAMLFGESVWRNVATTSAAVFAGGCAAGRRGDDHHDRRHHGELHRAR